ncbi:ATP-binding response regulator [Planktothrix paucivesiculata]|uniref:Circadian input-output histidine kinase CikA n=1 Tax=Planktothrix paucivesiculata PCC 9631 TaxID=671071 RepID=A0A7Z9BUQ1_9CYAN|nr:ATP-binding protein [Planktothrix paucivesiculata]VXD21368.1 Integral membrane sensor hybrid histidine kinase [Planktothrix paucivesiculata PCC 9631]
MITTQFDPILSIPLVILSIPILIEILVPEVFKILFNGSGFIPHGHCFLWKPGLVWMHVSSDLMIALAYLSISITLVYFVHKSRREIPFHWMFLAFGTFIIACGITHVMEVWTLWHPMYWLSGMIKVITAFVSIVTALALPPLVPQAVGLIEAAHLSEKRHQNLEVANQKLESIYGQLKELDHLKTQFFANISHELRTPLTLILGPTEQLLASTEITPKHYQNIKIIEQNARLLLKQVNDLLDVSKLAEGQMKLHYSVVDITQLVQVIAANFEGLAQQKNIEFMVSTPDSVCVEIDEEKIERVLLNLLSNAFKFTPIGGKISCCLSVSEKNNSPWAILQVQDTGIGIPPELRQVIFERFRQVDTGLTRQFGGTGLGLAIVKEFVELQGGNVTVEEAPQEGALFIVEFPLKIISETVDESLIFTPNIDINKKFQPWLDELKTLGSEPSLSMFSQPEKPLVLVVEDNPTMSHFVCTTLASDYNTAIATNGEEGLDQALALHPDLIISDIMMPGMSGDEMVQKVRTYPELNITPIVILTAKTDDESRVQLLREGAQDYLMKPFSVEELRARVSNWIIIKRTRDLLQQELTTQSVDLETLARELALRKRELQLALTGLQQQTEELAQANQLKNEFLAIVSHELRTPLNVILGWLYLLRTRSLTPERSQVALETIERNAKSLTKLIEDLLDISNLLQGKTKINFSSVHLKSVIQSVLQIFEPVAKSKGIELQIKVDESVDTVAGDPDRLQQIIQHLLDNAIKFTPPGGAVTISLTANSTQACIQVQDTGQGILHDSLSSIFESFRQADSSITRQHGGLGLGLAIVKKLVTLQQGTVKAESEGEGKGATFTVTFPLQKSSYLAPFNSSH